MGIIIGRSPTRVDLAGGTLDMWPLHNFVGGAKTINLAISIWTEAQILEREDLQIELISEDLNFKKTYKNLGECLLDSDPKLELLRVQIGYWRPSVGFTLTTRSESPIGGGLGGSSSLTISLLKAFSQWLNRPFRDSHHMVQVAHNMESQVLGTPTGTQDYYPAVLGGLNTISYSFDGISTETVDITSTPIEKNFLLVYTGKAHHSGLNNFEVLRQSVAKDKKVLEALREVKKISAEMYKIILNKEWGQLPDLFNQEYEARLLLAESFSSPEIDQLKSISLREGADAVKICGAGGGGCVLVWVGPAHRERVAKACQKEGFQVLDAAPVGRL